MRLHSRQLRTFAAVIMCTVFRVTFAAPAGEMFAQPNGQKPVFTAERLPRNGSMPLPEVDGSEELDYRSPLETTGPLQTMPPSPDVISNQIPGSPATTTPLAFSEPRVFVAGQSATIEDDAYRDGGGIELIPDDIQDTRLFSLKVSGRLQTRYSNFDDRGPFNNPSLSEFELERVRLGFRGFVYDRWLRYNVGTDWDSDGLGGVANNGGLLHAFTQVDLQDAAGIGWGNKTALRLGYWQTNFGRQISESSKRLQFVDRSIASAVFNPGFNAGIALLGEFTHDYRRARYELAVLNGIGTASSRPRRGFDNNPGIAFRLTEEVIGEFEAGESDNALSEFPALRIGISSAFTRRTRRGGAGSADEFDNNPALLLAPNVAAGKPFYAMDELPGAAERNFDLWLLATDASWKYCGWSLHGEYLLRWIDNVRFASPDNFKDFTHGFYVQGGYFLTEKVELAARHAAVYANGSGSASPIPGGYSNSFHETGMGLNFYFRGHNSKFQIDVFHYDGVPVNSSAMNVMAGDDGTMVRAQYQLSF
jgi:phosphate-selective porin OprO and OprP